MLPALKAGAFQLPQGKTWRLHEDLPVEPMWRWHTPIEGSGIFQ